MSSWPLGQAMTFARFCDSLSGPADGVKTTWSSKKALVGSTLPETNIFAPKNGGFQ